MPYIQHSAIECDGHEDSKAYLWGMFAKTWIVIKDDNKHTFEVVDLATNENAYTNKTIAMQRDGINVTCVLIPASNRNASKEAIKFTGYTYEAGLYQRLLKHHNDIAMRQADAWDESDD